MPSPYRRIRSNWNPSDTAVLLTSLGATAAFIANAWLESVTLVYIATLIPIAFYAWRASKSDQTICQAVIFGGIVAWLWPFGEAFVVHRAGWWGAYLAPGPKILETPIYCILIGWLASTYCFYIGQRATDIGYGDRITGLITGLTALLAGIIGENLVPAFVPITYGICYGILPALRPVRIVPRTLIFTTFTLFVSMALGFAFGFFPHLG
jgi:hypothetical protein